MTGAIMKVTGSDVFGFYAVPFAESLLVATLSFLIARNHVGRDRAVFAGASGLGFPSGMGVAEHKGNAVLSADPHFRIDRDLGCRFVDPAGSAAISRVVWLWFGTRAWMVVFSPDPIFRSTSGGMAAWAPW